MTAFSLVLNVTVVLALAVVAARLARRSRASVRHVVLAAAFAVLLVLPVASIVAPPVRLAVPAAVTDVMAPLEVASLFDPPSPNAPAGRGFGEAGSRHTGLAWLSLSQILLAVWIAGGVVFLVPMAVGLWQVRALRRTGLPWRELQMFVPRRVTVMLHESVPGPMTFGAIRPVIVLPMDARAWADDDLRRALVHELEHVRRGDWISQCLARTAAAAYWFHPFVWIAWRQLALEAERACDDAVVGRSDSTAYADQLVGLAERLSASRGPLLAMANRNDLSARVRAVLDSSRPRGRAGARFVAIATVATAVVALGVSSIRIVSASAPRGATADSAAQGAASAKPKYDVASIKQCQTEEVPTGARGTAGGTNASTSPGRFHVPCVTTEQLIYLAYASYGAPEGEHLANDDPGSASNAVKVRGGPDWVHSLKEKYEIEATAAGVTERMVLMGTMLQSLLEDRFKFRFHRDTEQVDMLALTVGKSGFKLKAMKDDDCDPNRDVMSGPPTAADIAAKPRCGSIMMLGDRWIFGGFTLSSLAGQISRNAGVHVIDRTGITDKFVYTFLFTRGEDPQTTQQSITAGVEDQLGLKLEKVKAPRGFIVIDAIERPVPDSPDVLPARATRPPGPRGNGAGR